MEADATPKSQSPPSRIHIHNLDLFHSQDYCTVLPVERTYGATIYGLAGGLLAWGQ